MGRGRRCEPDLAFGLARRVRSVHDRAKEESNTVDNIEALRHFALAQRERDMMAAKKRKRSVTVQLGLAARSARTALSKRLAEIALYPGQDAVLLVIGEDDGISLRDLALRLDVRPPTITKTVARLTAQGLVEKRSSQEDARRSHVYLTAAGQSIVEAVGASQAAIERAAVKGLSDKERKMLRKLLQKVTKNLAPKTVREPLDVSGDD